MEALSDRGSTPLASTKKKDTRWVSFFLGSGGPWPPPPLDIFMLGLAKPSLCNSPPLCGFEFTAHKCRRPVWCGQIAILGTRQSYLSSDVQHVSQDQIGGVDQAVDVGPLHAVAAINSHAESAGFQVVAGL